MPEKKKSPEPKTPERRMSKPQASTGSRHSDGQRATGKAGEASVAVAQPIDSQKQLASFEAAMKLFHARNLREARNLFANAAEGPERDVAHRARLHIAMCDRRLEQTTASPHTAEECYNYGVALINTRNFAEARVHLQRGLEIAPKADHIYYALSLAQALSGDLAGAYESLKRAIDLEPRNRQIARQDADFGSITNQPPFDGLLYPEKKAW
jgi:tetratricopeptide (TPR) repeat protein